jgi:hypothetical protein
MYKIHSYCNCHQINKSSQFQGTKKRSGGLRHDGEHWRAGAWSQGRQRTVRVCWCRLGRQRWVTAVVRPEQDWPPASRIKGGLSEGWLAVGRGGRRMGRRDAEDADGRAWEAALVLMLVGEKECRIPAAEGHPRPRPCGGIYHHRESVREKAKWAHSGPREYIQLSSDTTL